MQLASDNISIGFLVVTISNYSGSENSFLRSSNTQMQTLEMLSVAVLCMC